MLKIRSNMLLVTLMLLVGIGLLFTGGCDTKSKSSETPAGTQMALTSSSVNLNLSDQRYSWITATVTNDGDAVEGAQVSFSVQPASAGTFTPADTVTDADGFALVRFSAEATGSAVVTASLNGGTITRSINLSISGASSGGEEENNVGNIAINITPNLLFATGEDTALVNVVVLDDGGMPAAESTLVTLTAGEKFVDKDGNGTFSSGIDSLVFDANGNGHWDAVGQIPTNVYTNANGQVNVNYISGTDAITVYIKATCNDNGIAATKEASLQLSPDAELYSIYMASDSMQLSVKHTGGIETGMLRAVGYDIYGNPMPEGIPVTFFIVDGPGGGEHLADLEPDSTFTTTTNNQGIASCPFSSGTISGTVRIRAYSDTVISNATQVLISAGPPAYVVVGAEKCNVDFWDNVGYWNDIVAVVSDIYLNPVNDSTVVYFSVDEGSMQSHQERTKDHEGIATSRWFAGNNVDSADGRVIIMAETSGGTVADTSMFFNTHYPDTFICYGVPTDVTADGESKNVVLVTSYDLNGNPVIGGTPFQGDANWLVVNGGTMENGCYGASARVKITSAVLKADFSMPGPTDDGIGAVDYIQYWHGGTAASIYPCTLRTGVAYRGTSNIDGQTTASPAETIYFNVIIKDRWGNPLGDHTLNLSMSDASAVTPNTGTTNAYGEAGPFNWTAGAAGDYTLFVNDTDPRGTNLTLTITVEDATK